MSVSSGYWRSSNTSENLIECLYKNACPGGYGNTENGATVCAPGYGGNLCHKCINHDGQKYERLQRNTCSKCPAKSTNLFRVIGLFLLVLLLIVLLIYVNMKKRTESNMSTLMRIMTNYLQMLTATASFNIGYPTYLLSFYEPGAYMGDTDALISIDCFISDEQLNLFNSSHTYLKAVTSMLTPIALIALLGTYWAIASLFSRQDSEKGKYMKNFIISSAVVLYLLHPSLTASCFGLFNCKELDTGEYWLEKDL